MNNTPSKKSNHGSQQVQPNSKTKKSKAMAKVMAAQAGVTNTGREISDMMLDSGGNETLHLGSMKQSRKIVSIKDGGQESSLEPVKNRFHQHRGDQIADNDQVINKCAD